MPFSSWKTKPPPKINVQVRTLKDFSEAEIAALEKQYGAKIRRPRKRRERDDEKT